MALQAVRLFKSGLYALLALVPGMGAPQPRPQWSRTSCSEQSRSMGTFTRLLVSWQAMRLDERGLWAFLAPMQASGAPLPRAQLVQRCVSDPALLRFVADAAQAAGGHAAPGRAILPFFAVLACEVLAALPQARSSSNA